MNPTHPLDPRCEHVSRNVRWCINPETFSAIHPFQVTAFRGPYNAWMRLVSKPHIHSLVHTHFLASCIHTCIFKHGLLVKTLEKSMHSDAWPFGKPLIRHTFGYSNIEILEKSMLPILHMHMHLYYVYMYVYAHMCVYVCTCTHIDTYIHAYTHKCIYIQHTYIHTHMHIHQHTHIRIHMHTHIHVQMGSEPFKRYCGCALGGIIGRNFLSKKHAWKSPGNVQGQCMCMCIRTYIYAYTRGILARNSC